MNSDLSQLTPTSILSILETTKEQRQSFIENIMNSIDGGMVDPLKIHVQIKCAEKLLEQLLSTPEYKKAILAETEKYAPKGLPFDYYNSVVEIKQAGVKYDYLKCGDEDLIHLMAEQVALSEAIKKRQEFLKSLPPEGIEIRRGDELVQIYPPSRSSTTTVQVTLK